MEIDPKQLRAAEALRTGSILCGGVGSGKSRTALLYYYKYVCGGEVPMNGEGRYEKPRIIKDLYIITTAKKRDSLDWQKELGYFLLKAEPGQKPGVKIDSWDNVHKYKEVTGAFFIFDEQRVVGSGKWVRSFLKIAANNDWILLTATPGDTWSDYIPVFVANGFYKNRTEFLAEHAIFSRFTTYPKIERYINCKKLLDHKKDIIVDMGYKSNTEPVKHFVECGYDDVTYTTVSKDRWNVYKDEPIINASDLCYTLRKVVNSHSSRIIRLLEVYNDFKRVIVFYNFTYELKLIRTALSEVGIKFAEWNGEKHEPIPEDEGEGWIYLVQYLAGAEGWECTSTNVVLFYSLNYSYRAMVQAAGRIDRRNTKYDMLHYYYLVSSTSIDNALLSALRTKRKFNEQYFYDSQKKQVLLWRGRSECA